MTKKVSLKSILILDDDQEFRTLLKSLLSRSLPDVEFNEYDPIEKGEPENSFDWSKFDVLILDYYLCMHGFNGLDLFQKYQNSPDFPPTIMLTGAGNEGLAINAFKSGIKDYIHKDDLNAEIISQSINKVFDEHLAKQNAQHDLQTAEHQIQEDSLKLEKEADIINLQLQNIEEEKQAHQEGMVEIERIKLKMKPNSRSRKNVQS